MEFLKDYLPVIVTVGGWCMTLGLYIAKIKQHDSDIQEIKKKQTSTDALLQNINNTLTSVNTKVDLLIDNKIKTPAGK